MFTAFDYFSLSLNYGLLDFICSEYNEINNVDIKEFLGAVLKLGLIPFPNFQDYFSTK